MKLINIYSAAGQLEAEIIKGFLEAQGLEVVLNQESVGRTMGLSAGHLGRVQVLVDESQVEDAKSLLSDVAKGEFEDLTNSDFSDEPLTNDSQP